MRHATRVLLTIFVLTSISALANSVNYANLNVNFVINPNLGSGENIGGLISGPGVSLLAGGGTFWQWFGVLPYIPGSTGGGGTDIFWDGAIGELGSQNYSNFGNFSLPYLALDPATLNAGSFTFPTNGQNFTITVPASLGVIFGTIVSDCNVCPTFTLATNPGKLTLSFYYSNGFYWASSGSFTTTPEPGTLGLVATGIAAATWRRVKKRRRA